MNALAYVRMVLWSFFGIRRNAAAGEELASAKPVHLLATAIGLATVFGLGLWSLVQLALATLQ